jgi:hypothetical protein
MKFPLIVIYKDGQFARIRKSEFNKFVGKFLDANHIRFKYAAKDTQLPSQMIDYSGKIYELNYISSRRMWLAPLAPIVNLVTADCRINEGEAVKVKDLMIMSKKWKNNNGRMVRKFLVNQDPEAIFAEALFKAAWLHSYIELPESEWGEPTLH